MKTAYLFPGQGSQFVGMGRDLYDAYPEARARFDEADTTLGFSLSEVMFGSDDEAASGRQAFKGIKLCLAFNNGRCGGRNGTDRFTGKGRQT